jgi:hypothetical protein
MNTEISDMLSIRKQLERRRMNGPARRTAVKARPCLESLESRVVLYSVTGNAWPHPELVTISVMPDVTLLGKDSQNTNVYSNLISTLTSSLNLTPTALQNLFLKAAQVWAQQTNINFSLVSDNASDWSTGDYQQGDPGFGDIRIGGYTFGSTTLATAYQPPPVNNFAPAGDIFFNTGQSFHVGTTYDLFTVAVHEIGHALGLGHSTMPAAQMFTYYTAAKSSLNADDISGIRSVSAYGGARRPDAYDAVASNGTFATATNLNSTISTPALTALVQNLDITSTPTTADVDDYTFNVPTGTTGTLVLNVRSSGLSLLSPKVTVYAADQTTVLATAGVPGQYGTTLALTASGLTAGQQLYVKVQGADNTAFGTGTYAMTLQLGSTSPPTVPLPNTLTPNGNPPNLGGGLADSPPGRGHEDPHWDVFSAVGVHRLPKGPSFGTKAHRRHHHSGHRPA